MNAIHVLTRRFPHIFRSAQGVLRNVCFASGIIYEDDQVPKGSHQPIMSHATESRGRLNHGG